MVFFETCGPNEAMVVSGIFMMFLYLNLSFGWFVTEGLKGEIDFISQVFSLNDLQK